MDSGADQCRAVTISPLTRKAGRCVCAIDSHLDAVTPFVKVRASTTKNGKSAEMRLLSELVEELNNSLTDFRHRGSKHDVACRSERRK